MALSAHTNVAAAVANYFLDNWTALQQAGTAVPPQGTYTTPPPRTWMESNKDNKFYLIGSGATYKLASVSGTSQLPEGAIPVDLNVAYAIESKELSLSDWVMSRIADDISRDNALGNFARALMTIPEADLSTELSSMSQADLQNLLVSLTRLSKSLQSKVELGNLAARQMSAALLSVFASKLSDAIEAQALFNAEQETLQDGDDASFNDVVTKALDFLVQNFGADMRGARAAFDAMKGADANNAYLASTTELVASALIARLRVAADLAMLATSPEAMFMPDASNVQTPDGNVVQSSSASSREAQIAAVRDLLKNLLEDPALKAALVDAMKESAQTLGTQDLDASAQEALYQAVADALVSAVLANDQFLDEVAAQAVDFGAELRTRLNDETLSAAKQDDAKQESMV